MQKINISQEERWREVEREGWGNVKGTKKGEEKAKDVTVVPFPGCLKSALQIGNSGVP